MSTRRYIDMTGASDSLKGEIGELNEELQKAYGALAAKNDEHKKTVRRMSLGAALTALIAGLFGWWRGRKSVRGKIILKSRIAPSSPAAPAPAPAAPVEP